MSVRIMALIFAARFEDINLPIVNEKEYNRLVKASTAKLVCLALADCANDEGESAYPSIATLASKTELSPRAVIYTLDALQVVGIVSKAGISKLNTINYTVNIEAIEKLTPTYRGANDTKENSPMQVIQDTYANDTQNLVSSADKSLFKSSLNHQCGRPTLSADEYKAQTLASLQAFGNRQAKGEPSFEWLEERLRPLIVAFTEDAGFECAKSERTFWRKSLNELAEIGVTPDIIHQSIIHMQTNNLTIGSPKSILMVARSIMSKPVTSNQLPIFRAER